MASYNPLAVLLVDGYNIIGSWSWLKQIRDHQSLELARQELIESLINYTAYKGFETLVVFDAHYQKTPGCQEKHTSNVSVYYTAFAQTADTYIEKFCASFSNRYSPPSPRLIVATCDRAQRLTAVGYGAEWMSAQKLSHDIHSTTKRNKRKLKNQKKSSGRFLFNSLDAKTQERLIQLQQGFR